MVQSWWNNFEQLLKKEIVSRVKEIENESGEEQDNGREEWFVYSTKSLMNNIVYRVSVFGW